MCSLLDYTLCSAWPKSCSLFPCLSQQLIADPAGKSSVTKMMLFFTACTGVCSLGDSHSNKVVNKAEKALFMWICEMWGHGQWPHSVQLGLLWTTQEPERCTVLTLSLSCRLSLLFWTNSLNLLFSHCFHSLVKTSDTLFTFSLGFITNDLI